MSESVREIASDRSKSSQVTGATTCMTLLTEVAAKQVSADKRIRHSSNLTTKLTAKFVEKAETEPFQSPNIPYSAE